VVLDQNYLKVISTTTTTVTNTFNHGVLVMRLIPVY